MTREYYLAHVEHFKKKARLQRERLGKQAISEYNRAYRARNLEGLSKYNKQWATENKDRMKAYHRNYSKGYYEKNRERFALTNRNNWLKRNYGITLEQYNQIFANQGGACAICKTHQSEQDRSMAVDHCHSTNRVRGLLCFFCNTALGKFRDNPELLRRAVEYLKSSNTLG